MVNACPMFLADAESIDHLRLNCNYAQWIWRLILNSFGSYGPLPNSLLWLFEFWKMGIGCLRGRIMWKLTFWTIWKERNRWCFEGKSSIQSKLLAKLKFLMASWVAFLPRFQGALIATILSNWKDAAFSSPVVYPIMPTWLPLPLSALELNFDGIALGNPGVLGLGGVIRNEEGSVALSYSWSTGFCSINQAELMALNVGLREACSQKFSGMLVEGDSFCVI